MTAMYFCGFKSYLRDHGYAGVQYYLRLIGILLFLVYSKQNKVTEDD